MRNYSAIIIDDLQASIDHLLDHFQNIPHIKVEKCFTDPIRAVRYLRSNPIDLVILDVDFGEKLNGLKLMPMFSGKTKVILYTGYPQFEDPGYSMNVVDVLLKPVSYIRFLRAINLFEKEVQGEDKREIPEMGGLEHYSAILMIKDEGKFNRKIVWLKDVVYLEFVKPYLRLYTTDLEVKMSNSSLSNVHELLPGAWFKKCSRSVIFNINFFHSYKRGIVKLNHIKVDIRAGEMKRHPEFQEFLEKNSI